MLCKLCRLVGNHFYNFCDLRTQNRQYKAAKISCESGTKGP